MWWVVCELQMISIIGARTEDTRSSQLGLFNGHEVSA